MNRNITAVILIVLAMGIYATFTSSKWQEISAIRVVNDKYIQALNNADRLIQVRDKVTNDFNSLAADDRKKLEKMLPNTVDNIRLIVDMNNLANNRGLVLKSVRATMSGSKGGSVVSAADAKNTAAALTVDSVAISFSVSTTYGKFITFMRDLEANLRIMDITHLSMTANDTGLYDYSVELKTYWLRQ
ncbi:MAG: hypothetical protein NTZ38_03270 [Candidatus Taylorbacteria bacterium]|nr:hypothetical protein [Candidatus Taylorbacteria bacterium]